MFNNMNMYYLCTVFIKKFIYRLKLLKMKKVLLFVALAATVSFAACNNKKAEAPVTSADSAAVVIDSAAQVIDSAAQVVDSAAEVATDAAAAVK